MKNFRSVLTVFEIHGFKLKNKNNKDSKEELDKWTFCHISHGLIHTNFWVDIHIDIGYHPMMLRVEI